jgi:hypothetical protein
MTETEEDLRETLRKVINAVKTYQFTPEDTPEKAMAARDMDDALDDAKVILAAGR